MSVVLGVVQLLRTFQHVLEYLIRTRESMSDCQDGIRVSWAHGFIFIH